MLFTNDDQPRIGIPFQDIRKQRTGSGLRGVRINHVNVGFRRLQVAQIRRQHGLQLLRHDLEWRLLQNSFKLAQHQRVRREDANGQF